MNKCNLIGAFSVKAILFSAVAAALVSTAAWGGAPLNLNGSWEFRFEEGKSIEDVADPAFVRTSTVAVPGCFDMLPDSYCKRGTALYRRTFTLDEPVGNAWLVVDGMGLRGEFRIDGRKLGIYPYPYARLEIPTGPLSAGEHVLFAALDNRFDWKTMKLAIGSYDFFCHGGFYHGVNLSFDVRKLFVRTRDYKTGLVELEAEGAGDFEAVLRFDGGREMPATFRSGRAVVQVPNFRLWSPESPNLHTVSVSVRGKSGQRPLTARFGIRTIEAHDRRLWLNGHELYLKGANRHEAHPTFGAATSESLMVADIQNLKALGGNFFRGAHYQQTPRFLDLCDENGVLVWEESLGWGTSTNEFADATFCDQQVWQTREMVRASFNHPSVIFYAFMNEFKSQTKEGRALAERLVKTIRSCDSGRLVSWANNRTKADDICTDLVDVIAINTYPAWIDSWVLDADGKTVLDKVIKSGNLGLDTVVARHRAKGRNQPIIVSEMGTCAIYGAHDQAYAQWTEEFQAMYLDAVLRAVRDNPEVCGIAIWQFTDARSYHFSHLTGQRLRYKPLAQNLAGLYDGYRRPKASVEVVRRAFSEMPSSKKDR